MRNVHRIGMLVVALCVLLTVGPSVATADLPSVDQNDWESAYENTTENDNPNTNISQTLIQYNETAEKVIFRVVLEDDKWTSSKETGFYIDADRDQTTGLNRFSGSAVSPNLDDIGADYLVVLGNRDATDTNETWEYDNSPGKSWNQSYKNINDEQIYVNSTNGNLTVQLNTSTINQGEEAFDFKIAHLNESAVEPEDPGFEFLPDPKNTDNESITFDFADGVIGDTEVTGDITFNNSEGESEISDSDDVNVSVELVNSSGVTQQYTFDSYPDPVFNPPADGDSTSYTFSELDPGNYGENAKVKITITNNSLKNGTAEILGNTSREIDLEEVGDSEQKDFEVQFNPITANMSLRSNVSRLAPGEVANISVFVAPGEGNNVSEANATITFPQSNLSFVDDSVSYNDSFMDTGSENVSLNESSPVGKLKLNKSESGGTTSNGTMVHFELRANQSFVSTPVVKINESLVDGEEANADTLKLRNKPVNYSVESFASVTTPQENNFTVKVSADPNEHNISLIEGSLSYNDSVINVVKVNASGGIIANASHNNTVDIDFERENDNSFNYTLATNETGSTEGTNASGKVFNATFTVVDSYKPDFRTTLNQSINYSATAVTAPVAVPPNENDKDATLGADPGEDFIDVDQPLSNVSIDTDQTEITTLRNMADERMLIDVRVTSANNGNFSNISIYNSTDIDGNVHKFDEKTCDSLGSCEKTFEIQPRKDTWDEREGIPSDEYNMTNFAVELYGGGNASAKTQRYTYNLSDQIYKRGDTWEANQSGTAAAEHRGEVVLEDALTVAAYIPANGEETSDNTNTPWQDDEVDRLPGTADEDAALVDINNDRKINREDLIAVEREIGN